MWIHCTVRERACFVLMKDNRLMEMSTLAYFLANSLASVRGASRVKMVIELLAATDELQNV